MKAREKGVFPMKNFYKFALSLVLFGCICFSFNTFVTNANNGTDCTMGGIITEQTERFILDNFDSASTPEDLANLLLTFTLEHFVYDENSITIPQTADTNRFIFKNDFHGVCMDFSAFVKSVYQVVCRYKRWQHVGCHVVLGHDFQSREGHAMNYISVKTADGEVTIYELDLTRDLDRHQNGKSVQGIKYSFVVTSSEAVPQAIRDAFSQFYKYPHLVIT